MGINMEKVTSKIDAPKDFIVGMYGKDELMATVSYTPCKIQAAFFILCTSGRFRVSINLSEYTIEAHHFVTLVPHSFVQIHEVSDDAHFYYAGFSSRIMEHIHFIKSTMPFFTSILEYPVMLLPESHIPFYNDVFRLLIHGNRLPCTQGNQNIIIAVLTLFIEGLADLYKSRSNRRDTLPNRNHEIFYEFIQLLTEQYTSRHTVTYYAQQLGLTLPHFCTTVKKVSGKTPLETIASLITTDAKTQLKSTDTPVKEIAFSLGFHNLPFFNKYFKQHTGLTPQEYRRQERSNQVAGRPEDTDEAKGINKSGGTDDALTDAGA